MLKVLFFLPGTGVGGIGKFVKDVVSKTRDNIEYTFVTLGDPNSELAVYLKANGKFINYSGWGKAVLAGVLAELKNQKYDVVHAHLGCWSFVILFIAKVCGVKKRIAHSHSADNFKTMNGIGKIVYALSRVINPFVVTHYFACSDHACEYTFGSAVVKSKKYHRILNPVDDRFWVVNRVNKIREEQGIPTEAKVVCHVGYMGYHKNHPFIIRLASELKDKNIYWLLVGDGHKRKEFEDEVRSLNLHKVKFLGNRNDIPDILDASDVFILPSLLEGLGTVVLEAQARGKKCIVSENVTSEVDMGLGLIESVPLPDTNGWKKAISNIAVQKIDREKIFTQYKERYVELNACIEHMISFY